MSTDAPIAATSTEAPVATDAPVTQESTVPTEVDFTPAQEDKTINVTKLHGDLQTKVGDDKINFFRGRPIEEQKALKNSFSDYDDFKVNEKEAGVPEDKIKELVNEQMKSALEVQSAQKELSELGARFNDTDRETLAGLVKGNLSNGSSPKVAISAALGELTMRGIVPANISNDIKVQGRQETGFNIPNGVKTSQSGRTDAQQKILDNVPDFFKS